MRASLAHAVLMQDELRRLRMQQPDRYADVAERIEPLLSIQVSEMAKKLVSTRVKLGDAGITLGPDHFGERLAAAVRL